MFTVWNLYILLAGIIIDLIIGDPRWLYHPVQAIGVLIQWTEKTMRDIFPRTEEGEKMAGTCFAIVVIIISTIIPSVILGILWRLVPLLGNVLAVFWCSQLLATKSLKTESMKVYTELKKGDLAGARRAVAMIVGRDTNELTEEGVAKATIETIAENTSDGIIAPLVFMLIWGPVGGFFYKAINTMDSMVGYKNETYLHFGRFAAKLDDAVNYIPARISAYLMILAAYFCKFNGDMAQKIYKRDRYNHSSPNSAQTEAVMAGALEIQLAGDAFYFGKLYKKPTIGDPIKVVEAEDIKRANTLLYGTVFVTSVIFIIMVTLIRIF